MNKLLFYCLIITSCPSTALPQNISKERIINASDFPKKIAIPIDQMIEKYKSDKKQFKILNRIKKDYGPETVCTEDGTLRYTFNVGHHKDRKDGKTTGAMSFWISKDTGQATQQWDEPPMPSIDSSPSEEIPTKDPKKK